MHRDTVVADGSHDAEELQALHAAGVAVHRPDGRIELQFAAEEDIDLGALQRLPSMRQPSQGEQNPPLHEQPAAGNDNDISNSVVVKPPVMNICILIVGTHGDVQPFVAIAKRLQMDGHRVRLATHAVYRDFVMSHGVEFYPLGGDPKELAAYMVKTGGHLIPTKLETLTKDVPRNREMINEILHSTWPAVSEADPDGGGAGVEGRPFRAQAIIANPVSYGHIHVAERLGVPLHIMFPQPWVPTMAFPHPLSNLPYTGKWEKKNFLSYKLVDLLMWQGTEGIVNDFRTQVLKLSKIRQGGGGRDLLLDLAIPHAFMWSPRLVPKPADWGKIYDVIGTVTLEGPGSAYTPSPELEAFLGNDGGPIFVGFGSMVLADPLATTRMIIEAAEQANARVLIQSSWSDMAGDLDIPANIFFLGNCPHDWLMPRVSAVVHHGGAGTTAAGLLAGKPTFIVPFFGDQPFWGRAVVDAGVGVEPCPIAQLTTEKLREAFEGLMKPELRVHALALQDIMKREDGAGEAVRSFYRNLPTQDMWCDLDHERLATQWSVKDRMKICDRCAFIVRPRLEKCHKKLVRYNCVDYTARGPDSSLEGAFTGTAAMLHEVTGGFVDIVTKPAQGFSKHGPAGIVTGAMKGVACFLARPVRGAMLLADNVATGHANAHRQEGHRKLASVFDHRIMSALGTEDGLADAYSSALGPNAVDTVLFARKETRKKILKQLCGRDKEQYRVRLDEVVRARKLELARTSQTAKDGVLFPAANTTGSQCRATTVQSLPRGHAPAEANVANDSTLPAVAVRSTRLTSLGTVEVALDSRSEDADAVRALKVAEWEAYSAYQQGKLSRLPSIQTPKRIPAMNICLAALGTWNNGVKQFVAIGVRLKAQGHRVRLAANERFRTEIQARGLEFYPLSLVPESVQDFGIALRKCQEGDVGALQSFKEFIYSLWPAAYGSDPHGGGSNTPGEHFRADSLLWHPLLLGHVHVAARLGIPLQCASLEPLSPTFSFPHILSSISGLDSSVGVPRQSNLLSHGVVDATLWHGVVAEVLTQFCAYIGLTARCEQPDPLVQWEIPHVYLWNPALLPAPLDWGPELSVVGHVTLGDDGLGKVERRKREKERKRLCLPQLLGKFAFDALDSPVIYFGISTRTMGPGDVDMLLRKLDAATLLFTEQHHQQLRIIFQRREVRDEQRALHRSTSVLEVDSNIQYAQLFHKVAATVHWGEPDILAEGLSAGKPVAICGSLPMQRLAAQVCQQAQVGVPAIDFRACTVESLAWNFQELLQPGIRERARMFAASFNPELAIDTAIGAFYANLPLEAMLCDVDPSKIARVFDPRFDVKLSFEVYLTVEPNYDPKKGFVPYKPLTYDGSHPPTFSIRRHMLEPVRVVKPTRELDGVAQALKLLAMQDGDPMNASSCSSQMSGGPSNLVDRQAETQAFWNSPEEEAAVRQATNAAYERLVKTPYHRRTRDMLLGLFGADLETRRLESLRYAAVQ